MSPTMIRPSARSTRYLEGPICVIFCEAETGRFKSLRIIPGPWLERLAGMAVLNAGAAFTGEAVTLACGPN